MGTKTVTQDVQADAARDALPHLTQAEGYARRFLADGADRRPYPTEAAIDALTAFDEPWSDDGRPCGDVLEQLDRYGSPATTRTTGGRYYGFVMGGTLPVALGATWLASAWDQNASNWVTSPIAAKLEEVASRWLLKALDLPRDAAVGFVTGATMANFSALAAAQGALLKRLGWNLSKQGLRDAPRLRYVAGGEEHPSVRKALSLLGIGEDEIEWVPVDRQGRLLPDAMPALDDRTIVMVQAGNVNSGSFDLFAEICAQAREAGAWVHVDGAFGLWARASRSLRHLAEGADLADSWAVDAHKWLNVPYDSAFYVCRDRCAPVDMFTLNAPYLMRSERHEPSYFTPELSRRARGIEVWAALRHLGRGGLENMIDRCCRYARRFATELAAAGYEVLNDVVINQVVLAYPDDAEMAGIVSRIQASGVCWLGPTRWQGRPAMRISVSSWATTDADVDAAIGAMIGALPARS